MGMRRTLWLLALLVLAVLLAASACGSPSPTSSPVPTARPIPTLTPIAPTATPVPSPTLTAGVPTPVSLPGRRGGALALRASTDVIDWDVYNTRNSADWRFTNLMFNGLVTQDPYNPDAIVGDLAESWTVNQAGTEYTFKLRKAVWHDGKPVTASDIVYNLDRARAENPKTPTAIAMRSIAKGMARLEAVDDLTVKVILGAPSASFLGRLGIARFVMYPSHLPFPEQKDAWVARPIASGPFKYKEYRKGERSDWLRNDSYSKQGLPYLDAVTFYIITDGASATATWRAGRIMADGGGDGASITPALDSLIKDLGFVHVVATAGRSELHLNNRPPWNNPKVREALMIGMDRKLILEAWLKGGGKTMASPVLPIDQGGRWGLPASELGKRPGFPTATDASMARAKQLLNEAGVNSADVTIRYLDAPAFAAMGGPESIAGALEKFGFKVQILLPPTAERNAILRRGDFDMSHDVRSIQFDDPLDRGGMASIITGDPDNYGKWSAPAFDRLADEQEATLDPAQRRALIFQMQNRSLDNAFTIPLLYRNSDTGALPYVKNYPKVPYSFSSRFRWEQVWLDRPG